MGKGRDMNIASEVRQQYSRYNERSKTQSIHYSCRRDI